MTTDNTTSRDKAFSKGPETEQNLTVALRIRPINEDEIIEGATPIAHAVENNMVVLMDPLEDPDDVLRVNRSREKHYVFDIALDGSASQKEVYEQTSKTLIPGVIDGFNATVFAYGATGVRFPPSGFLLCVQYLPKRPSFSRGVTNGAGKTYTMLGTDDEPGIMAQALNDLFMEMSKMSQDVTYKVTMSYLEIYNEMIRDLLNPASGYLELREDNKGVQVTGLSEISAQSTREVMDILVRGNKERTSEPTAANKASSRSHAVLQITVKQKNRVRAAKQEVKQGRLFLIDLAGSERAANTHNTGKRMVEGAHINRSLLALGNCINALSDKNGRSYVNYRDSKLTRLLKEALGGNCRTVMIAHVSPASLHFEESRNTLVYADRAKNIKTKVRRNVMDVSYHIAQYTNIIAELREEIKRLRTKLDKPVMTLENMGQPGGNTEVKKLKDKLLGVFKEQMEMRRSLMDLNNTAMEISLDTTRNRLVIKRWEREKAVSQKHKEIKDRESDTGGPDNEAVFLTQSKELELRGESPPEPSDVQAARDDLNVLRREKERTEKIRGRIHHELQTAKDKAAKIEEMLPRVVSSSDQQEVLSLLCRVHELEIENMEMQSACLLRNFEIRKIDMIVSKYEQHRQLCDEIIHNQRALLGEKEITPPKDLEELYELYTQETGDMFVDRNVSLPEIGDRRLQQAGSVSNFSRKLLDVESLSDLTAIDYGHQTESQVTFPNIHTPTSRSRPLFRNTGSNSLSHFKEDKSGALFSHSPRAQEIYQQQAKEQALSVANRANKSHDSLAPPTDQSPYHPGVTRQQSIITLTNSTSSPTPPGGNALNHTSRTFSIKNETPLTSLESTSNRDGRVINTQQRQIIQTSTRNIHALALKRRSNAHGSVADYSNGGDRYEDLGELHLDNNDQPGDNRYQPGNNNNNDSNKLTERRLEQHNRRYGSQLPKRHSQYERASELTNSNDHRRFEPTKATHTGSRKVYGGAGKYRSRAADPYGNDRKAPKKRAKSFDKTSYQQLAKTTPRHSVHQSSTQNLANHMPRKSRLPGPTNGRTSKPQNLNFILDEGVVELMSSNDEGSRSTVQQVNTERGKGHTVQRKVRGPRVNKNMNFPEESSSPRTVKSNHNNAAKNSKKAGTVNNNNGNKPAPSKYGHADIGVSGFSLH